jgi:hypothetical protein
VKWVTRKHVRTNRVATPWLIVRFVDRDAEFVFVEPQEVAGVQHATGAIGFDAPGAHYAHDGGVTSFEQIIAKNKLDDPALTELARIVHAADIAGKLAELPEAAGLRAISHGFPLVTEDDHETLAKAFFLYDALYAYLKARREGRAK